MLQELHSHWDIRVCRSIVRKLKGKVGKETPMELYMTIDVLILLYGIESWTSSAELVIAQPSRK
jgi:hypothetical protein